jgi:hypothetical protein
MRFLILVLIGLPVYLNAQITTDSAAFLIRDIYRQSYTERKAYDWLTTLCKDIGHRLSGSEGAERAVQWSKATMDTFGLDTVWLQPVMVPHWVRGDKEEVIMYPSTGNAVPLKALALGNSVGSGSQGIRGEVIEVKTLDELRSIPDEKVKGKIVFYNRAFNLGELNTFAAYGGAADQRSHGPKLAASKGAIGVAIRSLASRQDDFPHTGMTNLADNGPNVPAVALSTNDAVVLSEELTKGPVELFIRTYCEMKEDKLSHNVIGEIKGSHFQEQIILIGGHLDSWDVGEGTQDDGAGCVQSMEVMYRLIRNGYQPRHTLRCVLFMNEENGLRGAREYANKAIAKNEFHLAAIESDGGSGTAQGFGCTAGEGKMLDKLFSHLAPYISLLEPYDLELKAGGGGADIGPLKPTAGILMGLRPDNSRYFDYHHAESDTLESAHPRELASGAAALTSLVILLDQYGLGL